MDSIELINKNIDWEMSRFYYDRPTPRSRGIAAYAIGAIPNPQRKKVLESFPLAFYRISILILM